MSGTTRVAGVIGAPVRHSLSPVLCNAAFAATGLDWVYAAFEVAPGAAPEALDAMRTLGLGGLSVTMPHKAAVRAAVDRCTPEAAALDAVNCVSWDGDALLGSNTDGGGFVDSVVAETGVAIAGWRCGVVGAGGAARAIVAALGAAGAAEIVVVNRSADRAAAAVALGGEAARIGQASELADLDLVVNATSVGMAGTPAEGMVPFAPDLLRAGQVVADIVYHPVQTPLLVAAGAAGARPLDGIGMLVHQAARAFRLWTGIEAPVAAMEAAARDALAARGHG